MKNDFWNSPLTRSRATVLAAEEAGSPAAQSALTRSAAASSVRPSPGAGAAAPSTTSTYSPRGGFSR